MSATLSKTESPAVQLPRPSAVTFPAPERSTVYFAKSEDQRYRNIVCRATRPKGSARGQITLVGLHIGLVPITVIAPDKSVLGRITVYVER